MRTPLHQDTLTCPNGVEAEVQVMCHVCEVCNSEVLYSEDYNAWEPPSTTNCESYMHPLYMYMYVDY